MGILLALALLLEMLLPVGEGRQHLHLSPGNLLQRVHIALRVQVQQHIPHRPALAKECLLGLQPFQRLQQYLVALVQPGQGGVAPLNDGLPFFRTHARLQRNRRLATGVYIKSWWAGLSTLSMDAVGVGPEGSGRS